VVVKEMQRALVPHTLTKRPEPKKTTKPSLGSSQGHASASASPSAIKAAAKSAALQLARQIAAEESDEELAPENYFSLGESSKPLPAVIPSLNPEPVPTPGLLPAPASIQRGTFQSDAPLDFSANQEGAWGGQQLGAYQQPSAEPQVLRKCCVNRYSYLSLYGWTHKLYCFAKHYIIFFCQYTKMNYNNTQLPQYTKYNRPAVHYLLKSPTTTYFRREQMIYISLLTS
jgi:hypothetical protein